MKKLVFFFKDFLNLKRKCVFALTKVKKFESNKF